MISEILITYHIINWYRIMIIENNDKNEDIDIDWL